MPGPADRRHGPRRDDDLLLREILDRLRDLEERLQSHVDRLGDDVDNVRDSAGELFAALQRALEDLRAAIDKRVRELEDFHITERTRADERTVRAVRNARWIASAGALAGSLGVAFAIVEHFAHI